MSPQTNANPPSHLPLAAQWLRQLSPPSQVLHVGAGQGVGAWHLWRQWPEVQHATLFDAATAAPAWLANTLPAKPNWVYLQACLGEAEAQATWHAASNPAESGTLQPESLQAIWPNLHTLEQQAVETQALDQLQTSAPNTPTWLLVDCLPALPVLQGATLTLAHCQVVWARVLLGADQAQPASLQAVQDLLQAHQFKLLMLVEELNPAVGAAIFVRDWPTLLQQQQDATSSAQAATAQLAALSQDQIKVTNLALETSRAETAQALTQRDAEAQAKQQATAQRDAEAKAKAEAQARIAALEKEKADIAAAKDGQIAALNKEKNDLAGARDAEASAKAALQASTSALEKDKVTLAQELGQAQQQLQEKQTRVQQLEAENAETQFRQQMLQEELIKAEGQIELIKDLLLREQGL